MTTILDAEEALGIEFDEIERRRHMAGTPPPLSPAVARAKAADRAARLDLTALCLSGGGIRSAAFCLGVLQGLAAKKLLNQFDYLSTVSGGGFIGGWLQMLLHDKDNVAEVEAELGKGTAPPLRRLRGYTNYLTPQTGPFSADTWASIMLYLRNMVINWLVFAPVLLLAALAPIVDRTALFLLHDSLPATVILLLLGAVGLTIAAWQGCTLVPSHRASPSRTSSDFAKPGSINRRIALPALAWAFLVPVAIEYGLAHRSHILIELRQGAAYPPYYDPIDPSALLIEWLDLRQWFIPGLYVVAMSAGFAIAWWRGADTSSRGRGLYNANALRWMTATVLAALLLWFGLWLIYPDCRLYNLALTRVFGERKPILVDTETALATCFPLWLIGTHVLQTTFYVAFRREAVLADLDREWLARLSGLILRIGLAWTAIAICCLVLPHLLAIVVSGQNGADDTWSNTTITHLFGGSTIVGALAAWLGKLAEAQVEAVTSQSGNRMTRLFSGAWLTWLLAALCTIFAVGLLIAAGSTVEHLLGGLQRSLVDSGRIDQLGTLVGLPVTRQSAWLPVVLQSTVATVLVVLVWRFGRTNINRFSMHAVYRNRLARAFVGSARRHRNPDPFTGFDIGDTASVHGQRILEDNPRLAKFLTVPAGQRLFPVINMTLNVTAGSNTAWTERKGECFIATPLVCGAAALHHPDQRERNGNADPLGAFVHTTDYAGMDTVRDTTGRNAGPRIGSVMTISGAAINANWGYHSSRSTAFLMALFNVRLGAWLPNPAVATQQELRFAKPKNSLLALMNEVAGNTTDASQAIYLSDGGHFENLGLYEMLRRRCRQIVVVDAGQDGDCGFFDLGNAIRKAESDFAVRITLRHPMRIRARSDIEQSQARGADALGVAVGDIRYPDDEVGRLVYIKPTYLPDIPTEVRAYGRTNQSFPHASSLAQWFSESEFESYRALGAWQMRQLTDAMNGARLDKLFNAADRMCAPTAPGGDAKAGSALA